MVNYTLNNTWIKDEKTIELLEVDNSTGYTMEETDVKGRQDILKGDRIREYHTTYIFKLDEPLEDYKKVRFSELNEFRIFIYEPVNYKGCRGAESRDKRAKKAKKDFMLSLTNDRIKKLFNLRFTETLNGIKRQVSEHNEYLYRIHDNNLYSKNTTDFIDEQIDNSELLKKKQELKKQMKAIEEQLNEVNKELKIKRLDYLVEDVQSDTQLDPALGSYLIGQIDTLKRSKQPQGRRIYSFNN